MRRLFAVCVFLLLALPVAAQTNNGARTQMRTSGTLPSPCRVGELYYKTGASAGTYACSAVNTWTAVGGGGGGTITGADTRVLFFNGADTPAGDANFIFNPMVAGIGGPLAAVGLGEQSLFVNSDWGQSGFAVGPFGTSGNNAGVLYLVGLGNQVSPLFGVRHGGTLAVPTTTSNGMITEFAAYGYDGSNHYRPAANIQLLTDGDPLMGAIPGKIAFNTTDALNVSRQALTLDSSQNATFNGIVQALVGYKSVDGSAGVSGATCSAFKDGLCVTN